MRNVYMILALALADPKAAAAPMDFIEMPFPPYTFGSDFLRFIRGSSNRGSPLDEFGNLNGAVFFTGSGPWGEGRGGLPEWRPAGLPPGGAVTFVAHIDGKMILPKDAPSTDADEMIVDESGVVGMVGTLKVTRTVGSITLERKYTLSSASARSVIIEVKITNHGASAVRGEAWLGSDDDFLGGNRVDASRLEEQATPDEPDPSVGTFAAFGHAAPPKFSPSQDAASSPCGNALELKNGGAVFYANTPPAEGSVAILEEQGYLSFLANPGGFGRRQLERRGGSWAIHMDFGSIGAGGSATRTVQFGAANLADIDELSAELALPTCGQYFDGASIADAGKYVCAFREPNKIEPGGPPVDACRPAKVPPSVDKAHVCHADGLARELALVDRAACPSDARLVVATHPAPALEMCRCDVHPEGFVPPPGATACTKTPGLFGPAGAVKCYSPSRDYDPAVGVQDGGALTWHACRSDMTPCKMMSCDEAVCAAAADPWDGGKCAISIEKVTDVLRRYVCESDLEEFAESLGLFELANFLFEGLQVTPPDLSVPAATVLQKGLCDAVSRGPAIEAAIEAAKNKACASRLDAVCTTPSTTQAAEDSLWANGPCGPSVEGRVGDAFRAAKVAFCASSLDDIIDPAFEKACELQLQDVPGNRSERRALKLACVGFVHEKLRTVMDAFCKPDKNAEQLSAIGGEVCAGSLDGTGRVFGDGVTVESTTALALATVATGRCDAAKEAGCAAATAADPWDGSNCAIAIDASLTSGIDMICTSGVSRIVEILDRRWDMYCPAKPGDGDERYCCANAGQCAQLKRIFLDQGATLLRNSFCGAAPQIEAAKKAAKKAVCATRLDAVCTTHQAAEDPIKDKWAKGTCDPSVANALLDAFWAAKEAYCAFNLNDASESLIANVCPNYQAYQNCVPFSHGIFRIVKNILCDTTEQDVFDEVAARLCSRTMDY